MHGADLSVIGGSCTAATVLTSAAAWEDVFDCRSNSHPLKAAFRGSRPKQKEANCSQLLSFSSYRFASVVRAGSGM